MLLVIIVAILLFVTVIIIIALGVFVIMSCLKVQLLCSVQKEVVRGVFITWKSSFVY